jgi:membrane protein YdbS with pleckstrin-like domain
MLAEVIKKRVEMSRRTKRTIFVTVGFISTLTIQFWGLALGQEGSIVAIATAIGFVSLIGVCLWFYGLYLWAKLKGRSGAWALLGLVNWPALIVMWLLRDKSLDIEKS